MQSRSATAASIDRVVLRFSKLKLVRPTTMLARFGKQAFVWYWVAWVIRCRRALSRIRVVAASQVTFDSPSADRYRLRLTHPVGPSWKLLAFSVHQTIAVGGTIVRSQNYEGRIQSRKDCVNAAGELEYGFKTGVIATSCSTLGYPPV